MSETSQASARTVRARFRAAESDSSRLRLLESAAESLAVEPQLRSALTAVLLQSMRFLAVDSGLLLLQEGGALTVQAAQGAVLPVGAQIPVGGALGTVLMAPMQLSLRQNIESRLRIGRSPEVALELLLPLRFGGKALGILALMSESTRIAPTEHDLQTLKTLAAMLGAAVSGHGSAKPRTSRREVTASLAQLTPREQQVFALLPRGLSNAEIASQLGIAAGTAKIHIEHILHKLGLKDRTQAAVRAWEWGHRT